MKKQLKQTLAMALMGTALMSTAQAEILMQWERKPLQIDLNVKEERILFLDKNVSVGIPNNLNDKIRVQSSGGAVYLTALTPFELSRVQLRDIATGQLILLDLKGYARAGKLEDIRITEKDVENNSRNVVEPTVSDETVESSKPKSSALPAPAALTRYAAQSLYAPLRTVEPLEGVHRVAMKLPKSLPTLLPNLNVRATPLESWGLDGYVVTAVRIKNLSAQQVVLDPRYLQGRFYAATFQHPFIGATGNLDDTTVVYLVTEGDINRAILPSMPTQTGKTKKKKS
ncbi:TIGR03749 family integrating conjugative element protein [Actinobacillus porcinus]|uniref:TIGR03749 family integrating conjugative element protein n=1 Tax=Actinobacillus porcinus TaxID=51048 RepID=UPI002353350E|nr:TIGR03749 family integrating conjugative element protein [Actinobacillus porcinus]MCI5764583.1 TIGR03749 family integrating conjugative element protein [Actinobacillus porcinus]MDY5421388.1 TIGR03749 family integrating conjugative element protein [Actinobacillus porcinus]MDY6216087.1 TIGR03749 family integrating conjugative element protein [Actinobacillus porcinus]